MDYGDLSGKGKFYDDKGKPILEKREKVVNKARLKFYLFEGLVLQNVVLDFYDGIVYRTDRRLLGIRAPDPIKARWSRYLLSAGFRDPGEAADVATMLIEKGGYQYFSLPFDEIMKVRQYRLMNSLFITTPRKEGKGKAYLGLAPASVVHEMFGDPWYDAFLERKAFVQK
jgi:hypothetical protein